MSSQRSRDPSFFSAASKPDGRNWAYPERPRVVTYPPGIFSPWLRKMLSCFASSCCDRGGTPSCAVAGTGESASAAVNTRPALAQVRTAIRSLFPGVEELAVSQHVAEARPRIVEAARRAEAEGGGG